MLVIAMTDEKKDVVTLTIDDQQITVPKGTTVYNAAMHIKAKIPIFCYQDRMPPFGACRVCLVEVEKMNKLQTSCTLEATEGMVVRTQSDGAVAGRKEILEFLLINHPLDCPICDKGGECPLQDNTLDYGPGISRFFEEKRRFKKPLPLGPVLMLDRERCIACARCTRFGEHVAGDSALVLLDRGYRTEVGTANGGTVESKFIGNTIMICPVGALTSQVYRFRARPWDNDTVQSTCTLCPVGCSLYLDSRDGEIMRTRSFEQGDVNDIWLCDKGWFGYEFAEHENRLERPLIRKDGKLKEATWDEALNFIAKRLDIARQNGRIAALGGSPLTTEENFLFQKFMRDCLSADSIDYRLGQPIAPISSDSDGMNAGMDIPVGESENLSHFLLLGIDITEEFPVIWLRLKQAMNNGAKGSFFGHFAPEIAPLLNKVVLHTPGNEVDTLKAHIKEIEESLRGRGKSAIFLGRQYLASENRVQILELVKALKESSPELSINLLEGSQNSMGAHFAGMLPDVAPGGALLNAGGDNALEILDKEWDVLYIAGSNPASLLPHRFKEVRKNVDFMIVQDLFRTPTAEFADVVLPVRSFIEKEGSFINIAGKVQTLNAGKINSKNIYSDGEIFVLLAEKLGSSLKVDAHFLDSLKHPYVSLPQNKKSSISHLKEPLKEGELVATFAVSLFDKGQRMKRNRGLLKLVKEPRVRLNSSEAAKRGLKNDQKVSVRANKTSIETSLHIDDGVADGTLVLPLGFDEAPFAELNPRLYNGFAVDIEGRE